MKGSCYTCRVEIVVQKRALNLPTTTLRGNRGCISHHFFRGRQSNSPNMWQLYALLFPEVNIQYKVLQFEVLTCPFSAEELEVLSPVELV